jgi:hypothetical protein
MAYVHPKVQFVCAKYIWHMYGKQNMIHAQMQILHLIIQ